MDSVRLWQQAASFAAQKHRHQTRKDGKTPYIAHPMRVALTVREVFEINDPVALAAALLHDTIEDTTADYDEIAEQFGPEVADVVAALTKDKRLPEQRREDAYHDGLASAPWQAKLVKLADVYDNVSDCLNSDMRTKALDKARRAIQLAGDDPRLTRAVQAVRALVDRLSTAGSM